MLRRVKREVETQLLPKIQKTIHVPLTALQRRFYTSILALRDADGALSLLTYGQLLSTLSQLRKVANHPKQILLKRDRDRAAEAARLRSAHNAGCVNVKPRPELREPEPGSAAANSEAELRGLKGEALIQASGKLALLDRLLLRLKAQGSRVLVFSQYTETLEILQVVGVVGHGGRDA